MTKEEARQIMSTWLVSSKGTKGQRGYIEGWFDEEDAEAFRMAIEALSAEPTIPIFAESAEAYKEWTGEDMGEQVTSKLKNVEISTDNADESTMSQPNGKLDLISRADVLKYPIRLDHYDEANGDRVFVYGVESVIEYVESLPSADRPSGEWVNEWKDIDGGRMYGACCSVCHTIGHSGYNYCPSCGARMKGGEDE